MRGLKIGVVAVACSLLFAAGTARADEYNKQTFLTFSGPVALPGIVLPAGTYTFQIANPESGRRVIQVMDKDRKNMRGLFFAIPSELPDPPDDPVVRFAERPAGSPQAIQAWFYPGERTGYEFVYPRSQAVKLAKANHTKVASYPDNTNDRTAGKQQPTEVFKNAKVERVDENSQLSDVPRAPAVAASQSSAANQSSATSQSSGTNQSSGTTQSTTNQSSTNQSSAGATRRSSLPQTSSPLALFELLSAVSLAVAFALRARRTA